MPSGALLTPDLVLQELSGGHRSIGDMVWRGWQRNMRADQHRCTSLFLQMLLRFNLIKRGFKCQDLQRCTIMRAILIGFVSEELRAQADEKYVSHAHV